MFSVPNVKTKRFRDTFIMHFAIRQQLEIDTCVVRIFIV